MSGIVQGVGFRPFVYGLAQQLGLAGFVLNDGSGVISRPKAPTPTSTLSCSRCEIALRRLPESMAWCIGRWSHAVIGGFTIELSSATGHTALIPPDVATCDELPS